MRLLKDISLPVFVTCAFLLSAAALVRIVTAEPTKVIHVRWRPDVTDETRAVFERELLLSNPEPLEGNTFAYEMLVPRPAAVRHLVQHPAVEDTHEIDRDNFQLRATAPDGKGERWLAHDLPMLRDAGARAMMMYLLVALLIASAAGWVVTRRAVTR
jgi:hypothetical protein